MDKDELAKLLSRPTISVTEFGTVVGLSRNGAYEAVGRGEIQTIRFGRLIKVPTAPLRKMLGLEAAVAA
jgi:hypothetical protein